MKSIASSITLILAISAGAVFADETFEKYDANRDKSITYVELAQAKKREFDKFDRNRDKAVSMEEFEMAAKAEESEAAKSKPESSASGEKMAMPKIDLFQTPAFGKLDGDKDQRVSLAEFGASIKAIINTLDTSADMAVSTEEYMTAMSSAQKAAASAAPGLKGSAPKGSAPKGTAAPKKPSDT